MIDPLLVAPLLAALAVAPQDTVPPVLQFPEPGLDDPAAYQGYETRLFRDARGNALQVYLDRRVGRVGHVWADAEASRQEPARLYVHDFANSGALQQILTFYKNGVSYPLAGRDDLVRQIVLAEDFDGDGHTHLLVAGNFHGVTPVRGRYDASYGLLLRGDGQGRFESVDLEASNLVIEGQVRDMELLRRTDGERLVVVARNDHQLQILRPLRLRRP